LLCTEECMIPLAICSLEDLRTISLSALKKSGLPKRSNACTVAGRKKSWHLSLSNFCPQTQL
jgi:hypothetical protein